MKNVESAKSKEGDERRGTGQRVHFEALVAVGEMTGNGGFEAESVDVSQDGMRLRAVYLPTVGDRLICRFDGSAGGEVIAEGEVLWKNEEAKGGEFGLRFVNLDDEAAAAVRAMVLASEKPEEDGADPSILRGARVRLHIEGLGSPMKARVRESANKEVEVGSNLEFLRVGRSLELEDVDQGQKREAFVDHVKVDVDPATNVPQLVVSLRFQAEREVAPATRRAEIPPPASKRDATMESEAHPSEGDDDATNESGGKRALASAARFGGAAIGRTGSALSTFGAKTKGAMSSLFSTIQKRREARAETKKTQGPKRMTAPPPAGALKSEGRKLVREDDSNEEEQIPMNRSGKRSAIIGGAIGLGAVLAIYGATKFMHPAAAATADAKPVATTIASTLDGPIALNASANNAPGAVTANVPLFGPTPLSTVEAIPTATPSALANAAPGSSATPNADKPAGDDEPSASDKPLLKEWGQGSPSHPNKISIKLDGSLDGLQGSSGANGFTLVVPNHRSIGSGTDYAKKDKRLAAVNVVNTSHGCEITVQFRGDVPPYTAKVKGDKIEIALGREGHEKVAKKTKHHKHH